MSRNELDFLQAIFVAGDFVRVCTEVPPKTTRPTSLRILVFSTPLEKRARSASAQELPERRPGLHHLFFLQLKGNVPAPESRLHYLASVQPANDENKIYQVYVVVTVYLVFVELVKPESARSERK